MSEAKAQHIADSRQKHEPQDDAPKWFWKCIGQAVEAFAAAISQGCPENKVIARARERSGKEYVTTLSDSDEPYPESSIDNQAVEEPPDYIRPEIHFGDIHISITFPHSPVSNKEKPGESQEECVIFPDDISKSQPNPPPSTGKKTSRLSLSLDKCALLFDPIARSFDFIYVTSNFHFHNYGSAVSARQPKRYDFLCSAMGTAKEKLVRADKDTVKNIRSALRKCCRKHGHRLGADPIQNVGGEFYRLLIPIFQKPDKYKPQPHLSLVAIEELDSDR